MIPNFEFLMTDRLLVFRMIFTAFAKHERTCTVGPKEIHFHSQGGSSALKPTTFDNYVCQSNACEIRELQIL